MWDQQRQLWAVVLVGNVLMNTVIATPIYVPQFIPGSTGRNIRNLPCVSRRTGETGVCMFAFTCAKANGTHLGTCIDRFYFGSCCKIDEEPDIFPQDNSIDDGSPSRPFVTTVGPIESNDIPEYFSRPKPIPEKKPPGTTPPVEVTTSSYSVQTTPAPTTLGRETTKPTTRRPTVTTTVETTTQPVRLSTFQTVQNSTAEDSTTETVGTGSQKTPITIETTSKPASTQTPSITRRPTTPETVTKLPSTILPTSKPVTKKPIHSSSSHKPPASHRPVHTTVHKPDTTTVKPLQTTTTPEKTTESTTTKTVIVTTTQRIVPATRFPPRNATTIKPSTQSSTRRPITSTKKPTVATSTKKPATTTRKPSTPAKRPTTKPTSSSFATTIPVTTLKPSTTVKEQPTIATTGSSISSTKPATTFSTSTKPTTATTKPTTAVTKPIKHKPTTIRTTTTTAKPTTTTTTTSSRPSTIATKPSTPLARPKPTKIVTTTTKTVTKQELTTTTEKTVPLSTIETTTVPVTKIRPTVETTKPTKVSSRPVTRPITTTQPTVVSSTVTQTSFAATSEATTSATSKISVQGASQTVEETTQTTPTAGLVTWTSSSDDTTTRTPEISTATTQMDQTESEWTPITTPDGWIMIQSPTTKTPETLEDTTIKSTSESTLQPTTSGKPADTTTEFVTKRPTILTTLSTIASVTIDTELPVPMETLNMSDYKQVCGRRLFPESRIVGGSRSSFAKWPWQISLRQWRTSTYLHKCGAALLNENWAITAAHCVENVPPSDLLLRIGEHDLANEDEPYGYQERRVQIVASHPQFDPRTFEYDLALLRFYEPLLPFQPNVLPICLPDDDESYVGRTAYVTGWGRLYDEGPLPSTLQEVAVPVINNTMCEGMYRNAGYIEHIPHIFICAGWKNGGFDSCEGDSGGPMVIQRARDKRWILAGVISWGIGCAVPNQPGVYTRISEFREWINQILQF